MKKIFIAIMAVAAAVSCSQELTVDAPKGAAIAFDNAFVENATRAADYTADNIKNFSVYGFITKDTEGAIFTDQKVAGSNAAGFTYSPAQYWVGGATYSFSALVPYEGRHWTYKATNSGNGVISFNNQTAVANQDLLFAYATRTTPASITAAPEAVAFTFDHVLSRVKFSFVNGFGDGQNITLKVTNVNITNAYANGTLALENGVLAEAWTPADKNLNVAFGDAGQELAVNAEGETTHYYLIPAEDTYEVTFTVAIYQSGVLVDTYDRTATVTVALERGKSYDLQATLTANNTSDDGALYPIEFTVGTVNGWENYTGADVTVPEHVVANATELAAAVAEGGNIMLTQDINLDTTCSIEKDITLDLNGKTLTIAAKDATVVDLKNYGKMNLINGKIAAGNAEASRRCVYNYGEMTINNVEFVQTYGAKGAAINNEAKMTIENATVNSVYYAIWNSGANADLVVNGGTFNCVGNNDSWKPSNDSVAWCYAVTNRNGAKMTVNGGYFSGNHGVIAAYEGSKVTLNAGTYECFATMSGVSDWVLYAYGDGAAVKYSADCDLKHATKAADACCTTEANGVVAQF